MAGASKPEFPPLFGPGFHRMTRDELCRLCVAAFPMSATRPGIMAGLDDVIGRLVGAGVAGSLWVDGSFLTQKIDPDDADLLLQYRDDLRPTWPAGRRAVVDWFRDPNRLLYVSHRCDTYLLREYPAGHPQHPEAEWKRAYWVRQYGFSRGMDLKGIAVIELTGGGP